MIPGARSFIESDPDVLLVNPPSPPTATANREGAGGLGAWSAPGNGFLYPPQVLAYAAAALRLAGAAPQMLDAAGERLTVEETLDRAEKMAAPLVAVLLSQISLDWDIAFVGQLRAALPRARLAAIGPSMASIERHVLERTEADHVLLGEAEALLTPVWQAICDLSRGSRLRRRIGATDLGLAGTDQDGRLLDLDRLPYPAWDLVPLHRYGFVTVQASRGCDDVCAFCPYVLGQGAYARARSPDRVTDELAWLATTLHPRRVILRDPVFAHSRSRVEAICQGLLSRKVALAWECESRPEHFDAPLLHVMRRAGCTAIKLGVETTSEAVLRALHRIPLDGSAQFYLQHVSDVVAACRSLGIACHLFVMTGLAGQDDDDVAETLRFLHDMRPATVHVKPFHRYLGLRMPYATDVAEEQERGERQARMMLDALGANSPVHDSVSGRARRWLARRMGR